VESRESHVKKAALSGGGTKYCGRLARPRLSGSGESVAGQLVRQWPLDYRLYCQRMDADRARCRKAGVPQGIEFEPRDRSPDKRLNERWATIFRLGLCWLTRGMELSLNSGLASGI